LPNGVDPSRFTVQDKTACRRRLGLPTDGCITVCVGHLTDLKNQSVLIRALAEVTRRGGVPPRLVLVGEGPNKDRLKHEAERLGVQEQVHLVGQKPHAEVPDWIGAADWLMLSSTSEGWPTVYFEAMACGRPVLTSNVSSARDAVCRNDYGLVVEPNTPEAFADALVRAQARPFDAAVIRAYAERHSWDNWAQEVIQIIEAVRRPRSGSDLGGDSVA
jgi:glycosyltransferase involved in cell wall biosynthesis